ncbi:ribosome biogenesis GTPase Der, partial [Candidatus Peregrinibacteria bacterium]|nr:ribosome biogenesis GTPase Der [Candidatus Peregrinibacteria bacterium]
MTNNTDHKLPFIAIVGKPNVGKSSLFNRLIGQKVAITSDLPGTTRDRVFRRINLNNINAILVDTGGLEFGKKHNIEADMQSQSQIAISEADLVLFLVDGRSEPTKDDLDAAQILRRQSKKIIFVANKIDHPQNHSGLSSWTELGFGLPHWISVIHNKNIEGLLHQIETHLKNDGWDEENTAEHQTSGIKIALIGRPNAGKSSLTNAILGQKRVIVSETPGTTRDSIDIELQRNTQHFTLIDTAGLRKRGKIEKGIEKFSSFRTIDSIERSDVTCLVLDYSVGIRAQDLHISAYIT